MPVPSRSDCFQDCRHDCGGEERPTEKDDSRERRKALLEGKGPEIRVEREENMASLLGGLQENNVICADPEALKQIASNLLSNALENSTEGDAVHLSAGKPEGVPEEAGDTEEKWVAISARDTGPRLPEEVREELGSC